MIALDRHGCPDCGHAAPHDIPGDTDGMGSCPDCAAAGRICDLPLGATFEPWTDADTEELAVEMAAAADRRARAWADLVAMSRARRAYVIDAAGLTADELATAAARFGIVADRGALPLNAARPASMDAIEAGRIAGDTRQPGNDLGRFARLAEVIARQRETGDVWAGIEAARAGKTTHDQRYYESADGFTEAHFDQFDRAPIYALGRAVIAARAR